MLGIGVNGISPVLIILLLLWTLPWKGYALWLSARNGQKIWFVVLLVVNTLAILDIIYIFAVGRPMTRKLEDGSSSTDASSE
jgi:methionyl-tRNA synthetase